MKYDKNFSVKIFINAPINCLVCTNNFFLFTEQKNVSIS